MRREHSRRTLEVSERCVRVYADQVPVVETGAAYGVLVDAKTEASDQVKRRAGRGAEARDVAGVRGDFRFDEGDVKGRLRGRSAQAGGVVCQGPRILA